MSARFVVMIGAWAHVVDANGHAEAAERAFAQASWIPPDQRAKVQRAGDNAVFEYKLTSSTSWKAVPA